MPSLNPARAGLGDLAKGALIRSGKDTAWQVPDLITSTRNPKAKYLRSLRLRKVRERERRYLVEGTRIVEEAFACHAPVDAVVYSPELLASERARDLPGRVPEDRRLLLSGEVFRTFSDRDDPQGVAAVLRIEDRDLTHIAVTDDLLVIVAHHIRDPGNLGSIIRTADAVAASGVVIVEPSVDVYDPQTVRATMGSLFALPIVHLADESPLAPWYRRIRAAGCPVLVAASSAHGPQVHFAVDLHGPVVLLVGGERYGLPQSLREEADCVVRLPMAGRATSLNVSAATAALAYEIVRQRGWLPEPGSCREQARPGVRA